MVDHLRKSFTDLTFGNSKTIIIMDNNYRNMILGALSSISPGEKKTSRSTEKITKPSRNILKKQSSIQTQELLNPTNNCVSQMPSPNSISKMESIIELVKDSVVLDNTFNDINSKNQMEVKLDLLSK